MFVDPKQVIENGWITHPDCKNIDDWKNRKYLSPNAIDFTVDSLFRVLKENPFVVSETIKNMRGEEKVPTDYTHSMRNWKIEENETYGAVSNMFVTVPSGYVAYLVPRSTMTRNGLFLASGFYDQGFKGHIGCTIHNRSGDAHISPGTRIGQIAFVRCEDSGITYEGGYNQEFNTTLDYQKEQ